MTDQYAVIGNPIEHSKSPLIHSEFAAQLDEDIAYIRILGDMEDFAGEVKDFAASGGMGLNITVPFKQQAFELADQLTARAESAGAVNTFVFDEYGSILGDNTDGTGLVNDLGCNHRFNFSGSRILLLGAGGASRGVMRPLLEQGIEQLVIANRTVSRAQKLAEIGKQWGKLTGCGFNELAGQQFDLIINATAAGLNNEVPEIPAACLSPGGWTYDMMYGDEPTAFVRWGLENNAAKTLDGLGMLVEQAAESFFIWRGKRPDTEQVINTIRAGI